MTHALNSFRRHLRDCVWWVRHRTIDRYHVVRCDGLRPGYWEAENRMLHAMFGLLREYVEHQLAWMNLISGNAKHSWWQRRKLKWSGSRPLGLAYLDWEIGLVYGPNEAYEDSIGKPTPQSQSAREIRDLYLWWADVRPKRPEPGEASGAYEAHEKLRASGYKFWSDPTSEEPHLGQFCKDTTDALYQDWSKKAMLSHEIEERYYEEDAEMMRRLVNVRRCMWT